MLVELFSLFRFVTSCDAESILNSNLLMFTEDSFCSPEVKDGLISFEIMRITQQALTAEVLH